MISRFVQIWVDHLHHLGGWRWTTPGLILLSFLITQTASAIEKISTPEPSIPRGFYSSPFQVTLSTTTVSAQIRYTVNGSTPSATNGILYSGPFTISSSTPLRAIAFASGLADSDVMTHSYLFTSDVLTQSSTPAGYPDEFAADDGNGPYPADYEMDPEIVTHPNAATSIASAMTALPSLSLVMDVENLFDPATGIYSHPNDVGVRPIHLEWFPAQGGAGFSASAAATASTSSIRQPKRNFDLLFDDLYGEPTLEFPFFATSGSPDEVLPVASFDRLTLLGGGDRSWSAPDQDLRQDADYIIDEWVRRTHLAMGGLSPHGTFSHLYLNELYWGVYNLAERPDEYFYASYLGGNPITNFEIISPVPDLNHAPTAEIGTLNAYNEVIALANSAAIIDNITFAAIAARVDLEDLADYVILAHYSGDSAWAEQTWRAYRKTIGADTRFKFTSWATHKASLDLNVNTTTNDDSDSPARIFKRLLTHNEFRILLGDRIQKHFFNGGALNPSANAARYQALVATLDQAIIAESARWGDHSRDNHNLASRGPTDYFISSTTELASLTNLLPGDTITWRNGTYLDQQIEFNGTGTAAQPITLRAETPGGVLFQGVSWLAISGSHLLVSGFRFEGGDLTNEGILQFRSEANNALLAHHCRVTHCTFENFIAPLETQPPPPEPPLPLPLQPISAKYINIHGTYNRLDHCGIGGKTNNGVMIVVWLIDNISAYHTIDHNYIHDAFDDPTGNVQFETMRVGDSATSKTNARCTIADNLFYRCSAETEIVSNKSSENQFLRNTFLECKGAMTLRQGDRNLVEGNFFLGNNVDKTGGVRIVGANQTVINNYFANLKGTGFRGALVMMSGIPNSPLNGYDQVINATVAHNTFVNVVDCFHIADGFGTELRTLTPLDCVIANNIVSSATAPLVRIDAPPTNLSWQNNIFFGADPGIVDPGISVIDPQLVLSNGLHRLSPASPAIDTAGTVPLALANDVFGIDRLAPRDIGAEEFSQATPIHLPIEQDQIGPHWRIQPSYLYSRDLSTLDADPEQLVEDLEQRTWQQVVTDTLNQYLPNRGAILLGQYQVNGWYDNSVLAPQLSQYGGNVDPWSVLSISNPNATGDIYYTTDGSDPRDFGGVISANAIHGAALANITIQQPLLSIKARILSGAVWSSLQNYSFQVVYETDLVINEIHYQDGATLIAGDWIEIHNLHSSSVHLDNWTISTGLPGQAFTIPLGITIPAEGYIVLAEDPAQFAAAHPDVTAPILGGIGFTLPSSGSIILTDPGGLIVDHVDYLNQSPWPSLPNGSGPALCLIDPNLDNSIGASWMGSPRIGGTPGAANTKGPTNSRPSITFTHPLPNTAHPIGSLVTIEADAFDSDGSVSKVEFFVDSFDDLGPLSIGTDSQAPFEGTGWVPSPGFHRLGALVTDDKGWQMAAQAVIQVGASPMLVINEINYQSPNTPSLNAGDWVEFHNRSALPVNLSSWSLSKASPTSAIYQFASGTTIAPGGFVVVAQDHLAFSNVHPSTPPLARALGFGLSTSDSVSLFNPIGTPIDVVNYTASSPWPTTSAGSGPTLCLISPSMNNALPGSWTASPVNTGSPGASNNKTLNEPPAVSIIVPLANAKYFQGVTVNISVVAIDDLAVSGVELFAEDTSPGGTGPVSIGQRASAPYNFSWTPFPGTYDLTAVATDSNAVTTTSAVVPVTIVRVNEVPVVTLTKPLSGVYYVGDTIEIEAQANDTDGEIIETEFFVDGVSVNVTAIPTSPGVYHFAWTAANSTSSVSFSATVTDDSGETGTSESVNINILELGNGPYVESGGNVMIEAENPTQNTPFGGMNWIASTSTTGFLGTGYMTSNVNIGERFDNPAGGESPMLTYRIEFTQIGDYVLWMRSSSDNGSDDSAFYGVDGSSIETYNASSGTWHWRSDAPIKITTTGIHEVKIWMREDGLRFDRLFLTRSGITPTDAMLESFYPILVHPLQHDDDDGLVNFYELFLGMNPQATDPTDSLQSEVQGNALTLTYPRARTLHSDLGTITAQVLWSEDLVTWHLSGDLNSQGNPVMITEAVTSAPGVDPETVEASVSSLGVRVFAKLVVTRDP